MLSRVIRCGYSAVARDSNAERAAVSQSVISPVVGPMAAENLTAAAYAADTPAQTINNVQMTLTKGSFCPVRHTGEETRSLQSPARWLRSIVTASPRLSAP